MTEHIIIRQNETYERLLVSEKDCQLHFVQEAGSTLRLHLVHWDDSDTHNLIHIEQAGEHCQTEIYGLCMAHKQQVVSNTVHVLHAVGNGQSKQLFKYILADQAQGYFQGRVHIAVDAQKVAAEQLNRNILLSTEARMRSLPELEIYADDVKASHGATNGQLDENAIFYMLQRGLSAEQAKRLLLRAFALEVIDSIQDESTKENLTQELDLKLNNLTFNI